MFTTDFSVRVRRFLRTPKGTLACVFFVLLALGGTAAGWSSVLPQILVAVASASMVDLLIARLDQRRLGWPSSAILSGMIIAFVLGPETPLLVTGCLGIVAVLSKHLFATSRWHVFNPAALALLVSIPLFATGQSWWGALPDLGWPFLLVLLVGGALVVGRIDKFPLVLAFAGTYFGLFTLVALIQPTAVAEMFRSPFIQSALFLAFFMLTDPPTSPSRRHEQVWVGALAGATCCVAHLLGVGQAYLLIGVLTGNVALAIRRWRTERTGGARYYAARGLASTRVIQRRRAVSSS